MRFSIIARRIFEKPLRCPICKSTEFARNEDGFIVCKNCGLVISEDRIMPTEFYNVRKVNREIASPLQWSAPMRNLTRRTEWLSVEEMIDRSWKDFISLVHRRAPKYLQYVEEFRHWLFTKGVKVLCYAMFIAEKHGCKYKGRDWLKGQMKQEGCNILLNLFATWLHKKKSFTIYKICYKDKLTAGVASVYKWKRYLERLERKGKI